MTQTEALKILAQLPITPPPEAAEKLNAYVALLSKWNPKINLVSPASLKEVWTRHVLDSAQLISYLPSLSSSILDMGSGAGLPGIILAILGATDVHLAESDQRKCAFLQEALRVTNTKATIHNARVENLSHRQFDVIAARALTSLTQLLEWAEPFIGDTTLCIFPKGKTAETERFALTKQWQVTEEIFASMVTDNSGDAAGWVIVLSGIKRK